MTLASVTTNARKLANARVLKALAKTHMDEALEALKPIPLWKEYGLAKALASEANALERGTKADLVEGSLDYFDETNDRHILEGVTVFDRTELEITDEDELYAWVIKNARYLVNLNGKELKSLAQSRDIPGAKIIKVPGIRIASDMSAYVTPEEESVEA